MFTVEFLRLTNAKPVSGCSSLDVARGVVKDEIEGLLTSERYEHGVLLVIDERFDEAVAQIFSEIEGDDLVAPMPAPELKHAGQRWAHTGAIDGQLAEYESDDGDGAIIWANFSGSVQERA